MIVSVIVEGLRFRVYGIGFMVYGLRDKNSVHGMRDRRRAQGARSKSYGTGDFLPACGPLVADDCKSQIPNNK
jgi:hypothetical protein